MAYIGYICTPCTRRVAIYVSTQWISVEQGHILKPLNLIKIQNSLQEERKQWHLFLGVGKTENLYGTEGTKNVGR